MCLSNIKDTYLEFLCSNQKFEEVFMNHLKAFVYVLTITAISLNLKIYDTKKNFHDHWLQQISTLQSTCQN